MAWLYMSLELVQRKAEGGTHYLGPAGLDMRQDKKQVPAVAD